MKIIFLMMTVVGLLVFSSLAQSGENLPTFRNIFSTTTAPVNGTNCVQTLTFGATITGGTFKLSFDGSTTSSILWSSTNWVLVSRIQTALEALNSLGTGGAQVAAGTITNGANGTVLVTIAGNRGHQVVPAMTVADNSMTGSAHTLTVSITTPGVEADGRILPKGSLDVALDTGKIYANLGNPLNPVWAVVGSLSTPTPTPTVTPVPTATPTVTPTPTP